MKSVALLILICFFQLSLPAQEKEDVNTIGAGQVPSVVKDKANRIHIAYGYGDSIMMIS